MKKYLYTVSFVALFGFITNAQSAQPAQSAEPVKKQEPAKKETVNPDGTLAPAVNDNSASQTNQPVNATKSEEPKPAKKRMAITEKGVPASKSTDTKGQKTAEPKKAEPVKTEKH